MRILKSLIFSLLCLVAVNVHAQSMHSLTALAAAEPYADQYSGQTLWLKREYQGFKQYLSAVRINKYWGITAGHSFLSNGAWFDNHVIGNGSNWMTDPGETRVVTEYHIHPTWLAGNGGGWGGTSGQSNADLALIKWDVPLDGDDLEIAPINIGDLITYAGFGRPATPATGLLPVDGQSRAFDGEAYSFGSLSGAISPIYVRTNFWQSTLPGYLPMGGVGTNGFSGGPGFNMQSQLVSLVNAGISSPNINAITYGLRLELYKDWIESLTDLPNPLQVAPIKRWNFRGQPFLGTTTSLGCQFSQSGMVCP